MSEEVSASLNRASSPRTAGSALRASAPIRSVRLEVRPEEKAAPMSEAPRETPTSRKKLLPLVAVPRCLAGRAFCTTVTRSWKNSPMPAPMRKVAAEICQTGDVVDRRESQKAAPAATRGPATG